MEIDNLGQGSGGVGMDGSISELPPDVDSFPSLPQLGGEHSYIIDDDPIHSLLESVVAGPLTTNDGGSTGSPGNSSTTSALTGTFQANGGGGSQSPPFMEFGYSEYLNTTPASPEQQMGAGQGQAVRCKHCAQRLGEMRESESVHCREGAEKWEKNWGEVGTQCFSACDEPEFCTDHGFPLSICQARRNDVRHTAFQYRGGWVQCRRRKNDKEGPTACAATMATTAQGQYDETCTKRARVDDSPRGSSNNGSPSDTTTTTTTTMVCPTAPELTGDVVAAIAKAATRGPEQEAIESKAAVNFPVSQERRPCSSPMECRLRLQKLLAMEWICVDPSAVACIRKMETASAAGCCQGFCTACYCCRIHWCPADNKKQGPATTRYHCRWGSHDQTSRKGRHHADFAFYCADPGCCNGKWFSRDETHKRSRNAASEKLLKNQLQQRQAPAAFRRLVASTSVGRGDPKLEWLFVPQSASAQQPKFEPLLPAQRVMGASASSIASCDRGFDSMASLQRDGSSSNCLMPLGKIVDGSPESGIVSPLALLRAAGSPVTESALSLQRRAEVKSETQVSLSVNADAPDDKETSRLLPQESSSPSRSPVIRVERAVPQKVPCLAKKIRLNLWCCVGMILLLVALGGTCLGLTITTSRAARFLEARHPVVWGYGQLRKDGNLVESSFWMPCEQYWDEFDCRSSIANVTWTISKTNQATTLASYKIVPVAGGPVVQKDGANVAFPATFENPDKTTPSWKITLDHTRLIPSS